MQKSEIKYKNKLGLLIKENSKHFWRYVKAKRGKKSGITSVISDNGTIVHSAKDIANVLNSQYMKVFCKDSDENVSSESCRTSEIMQPVK